MYSDIKQHSSTMQNRNSFWTNLILSLWFFKILYSYLYTTTEWAFFPLSIKKKSHSPFWKKVSNWKLLFLVSTIPDSLHFYLLIFRGLDFVPNISWHSKKSQMIVSPKKKVKVESLSRVQLFVIPWAVAWQAPPSMGFSRQEYWSGVPFPFQGIPDPGVEPRFPTL